LLLNLEKFSTPLAISSAESSVLFYSSFTAEVIYASTEKLTPMGLDQCLYLTILLLCLDESNYDNTSKGDFGSFIMNMTQLN
jgi:hypothetical protein